MTARHALTILAVDDLARAAAFYEAAFGWPRQVDSAAYVELALPEGQRLGLYRRQDFARSAGAAPGRRPAGEIASTELYLLADDLEVVLRRLEGAGARLLGALAAREWGDEVAYFADLDGNVLAVARPLGAEAGETPAGLRALARRWIGLWERDDPDGFEALHAPGFLDRSPAGRGAGREEFRDGLRQFRRAFPDFAAAEIDPLVDWPSRQVAIRWRGRATHLGPFMGHEATGRTIELQGIEIIRLEGGRIVERWGEWDGAALEDQLAHARTRPGL